MAIKTERAKVSRALDFFHKDIYIGIGKSSAWVDDNNPPAPDPDAAGLEEPIGYRKADKKYLVIPYDNREVGPNDILIDYVNGTQWLVIPEENALQEKARYVYIETTILPEDFPLGPYRQVGIFTNLVKQVGVGEKYNLLPSEVADPGILEVLDNRKPSTRQDTTKEQLCFILAF